MPRRFLSKESHIVDRSRVGVLTSPSFRRQLRILAVGDYIRHFVWLTNENYGSSESIYLRLVWGLVTSAIFRVRVTTLV